MPHKAFKDGYTAGWISIRGGAPVSTPAYTAVVGEPPYRTGVAHGVRELKSQRPIQHHLPPSTTFSTAHYGEGPSERALHDVAAASVAT